MARSSLIIDIDDPRSDKIAEAISNKTSKKILSLLAERDMTGSEISSKLGSPLNTVTYNLKKLVEAGLVEKTKKIFWSSKGKRMDIFTLSDKRIVISPRRIVRGVAPALIFALVAAFLIFASTPDFSEDGIVAQRNFVEEYSAGSALKADSGAPSAAGSLASETSGFADENFSEKKGIREKLYDAPNAWAWFLIGALTALAVFLLWNMREQDGSN